MATLDALASSQPLASPAFSPRHTSSQPILPATSQPAELMSSSASAAAAAAAAAYWTPDPRQSWSLNPHHSNNNLYQQDPMTLNPNIPPTTAMSQPYELSLFPPLQHQPHQHQQHQHPMTHTILSQGNNSHPQADSSSSVSSSTSPPSPSLASTDRYHPRLPGPENHNHPLTYSRQPPPPPPPQQQQQQQPWPSYSLPAMNGPVMSNVHNPNGQMSLMGGMSSPVVLGFNSGHAASMQQIYGGGHPSPPHASPGPAQDRPFKCDQCPQSFNRNHDLKRHKRIHLSVKPFPCTHCDKSFSRKDALKRHLLVKGCGKGS